MDLNLNLGILDDKFNTADLKEDKVYDVFIVGGGPAAITAAIYSARKGLCTALAAKNLGGQISETRSIENYLGFDYIESEDLISKFIKQLKQFNIAIREEVEVTKVESIEDAVKKIHLSNGQIFTSRTVIIATGSKWRRLNIPGEDKFIGQGVAFCTICDGPFYRGRDVVVVGGGNSGIEAAMDLVNIVNKLTIIEFQEELKADKILIDKMNKFCHCNILTSSLITEIRGEDRIKEIVIKNRKTNEDTIMPVDGVFVEIGLTPNSDFVKTLVDTNQTGEIIVNSSCCTSVPGIFAAGDVTCVPYKQVSIASGEGAKAALAANNYLRKLN